MTRLGMIARCDDGGLATITREFFRHLAPERTLVLRLGSAGQGVERPERYAPDQVARARVLDGRTREVSFCEYPPPVDAIKWLLDGVDVLYTAETPYHADLPKLAAERDVRVVLHAMPELFDPAYVGPTTEVWLPTSWEIERVADRAGHEPRVVPVPIALDRFGYRYRVETATAFHLAAPAMRDRNGSEIVRAAIPLVERDLDWYVRGGRRWPREVERCPRVDEYWEWPDADVLVLPRRYAGLSLPMQEAAARGMPVVTLDREPERSLPFTLPVPSRITEHVAMKGGTFPLDTTEPRHVAAMLDSLYPDAVQLLSKIAVDWARAHSWDALRSTYSELLGAPTRTSTK